MNTRLRQIIDYKTGGKQKAFAELIGWRPQYLGKLLHGDDFGLKPVIALLTALPEIDARWFLFGEGEMLAADRMAGLKRGLMSNMQRVLELERFMCVMTPEELGEFETAVCEGRIPAFPDALVSDMEARLAEKNKTIEERYNDALGKSVLP